jgi:hypothetical protein
MQLGACNTYIWFQLVVFVMIPCDLGERVHSMSIRFLLVAKMSFLGASGDQKCGWARSLTASMKRKLRFSLKKRSSYVRSLKHPRVRSHSKMILTTWSTWIVRGSWQRSFWILGSQRQSQLVAMSRLSETKSSGCRWRALSVAHTGKELSRSLFGFLPRSLG